MTGRLLFFIYLFGPDVKTAQNQRDRRLHSWPAYKELLTLLLLLQHKLFSTIFSKTLRKFTSPRRVSVTFHSNNVTKANYFVGKLLVASTMKTCCYDNSMNLNRLCVIINTVWMMREWVNKWILLPWLVGDRVSNKNGIVKKSHAECQLDLLRALERTSNYQNLQTGPSSTVKTFLYISNLILELTESLVYNTKYTPQTGTEHSSGTIFGWWVLCINMSKCPLNTLYNMRMWNAY